MEYKTIKTSSGYILEEIPATSTDNKNPIIIQLI
jgi:hypothetical protein